MSLLLVTHAQHQPHLRKDPRHQTKPPAGIGYSNTIACGQHFTFKPEPVQTSTAGPKALCSPDFRPSLFPALEPGRKGNKGETFHPPRASQL